MFSERGMVQRVYDGEPGAGADLFVLFYPRMLRVCNSILGPHGAAPDEVARAAFALALTRFQSQPFDSTAFAWVRKLCVRECYIRLQSRIQVLADLLDDMDAFILRTAAEDFLAGRPVADMSREQQLWRELLRYLPADRQKILERRNLRALQYSAASQDSGIPLGSVLARLLRSRDQMKMTLEDISNRYRTKGTLVLDPPTFAYGSRK